MIYEIKVPSPGESITEVVIARWLVKNGDYVNKDQEIAEIESDKATLPLLASSSGKISILTDEGSTVNVGKVVCNIDAEAENLQAEKQIVEQISESKSKISEPLQPDHKIAEDKSIGIKITPVAKKIMDEHHVSSEDFLSVKNRISKKEILEFIDNQHIESKNIEKPTKNNRNVERIKMSQLRKKLSSRLLAAKNETAMLTTFNEVDMTNVLEIRTKYQEQFVRKHGIKLGLMSFFTKASCIALQQFPAINSMIDNDEIVFHKYCDLGIAVQTPKGLMVPNIRNAENLSLAEIEISLSELADKARKGKISIDELSNGTFTITNGGTFGSLLSTPIINYPQAAILGLHNIVERPVAINGKVEIRKMMYVALSYDHRLIDGKDSVSFLVTVKKLIENPTQLLTGIKPPEEMLLGL